MRQFRSFYLILSAAVLIAALALMTLPTQSNVFAQADPAADTPTPQPGETPTETPTATPVPTETNTPEPEEPPTATPTVTNTSVPTATDEPDEPTSTPAPPAAPVAIPEPITVVLFGTGLAALSAAAARRKKENDKGDKQ